MIDLETGAELAELARVQAAVEGIDHRSGEVADLVRAALSSNEVMAAVGARDFWREVYVGAPLGAETGVEGFIDLLYEEDDGFVIVDYKTYSGDDGDLAQKRDEYTAQGAAYALAVREATGRPVKRVTFLFLGPQGARSIDIEDLDGAVDRLCRELDKVLI